MCSRQLEKGKNGVTQRRVSGVLLHVGPLAIVFKWFSRGILPAEAEGADFQFCKG
jgi:hypothetical protein